MDERARASTTLAFVGLERTTVVVGLARDREIEGTALAAKDRHWLLLRLDDIWSANPSFVAVTIRRSLPLDSRVAGSHSVMLLSEKRWVGRCIARPISFVGSSRFLVEDTCA